MDAGWVARRADPGDRRARLIFMTDKALPMLDRIIESIHDAVELLPPGSAGRTRVEETREYFTFIREDARGLDERWRTWRSARNG